MGLSCAVFGQDGDHLSWSGHFSARKHLAALLALILLPPDRPRTGLAPAKTLAHR